jgi:hypothetical protein
MTQDEHDKIVEQVRAHTEMETRGKIHRELQPLLNRIKMHAGNARLYLDRKEPRVDEALKSLNAMIQLVGE